MFQPSCFCPSSYLWCFSTSKQPDFFNLRKVSDASLAVAKVNLWPECAKKNPSRFQVGILSDIADFSAHSWHLPKTVPKPLAPWKPGTRKQKLHPLRTKNQEVLWHPTNQKARRSLGEVLWPWHTHTPPPPDKNEWKWLHFCTVLKEFTTKLFLEEAGVFSCWVLWGV